MILERAEIPVKPGQEEAFAAMMATEGLALLSGAAGCHGARCGRGVEQPERFLLLLEWDSVDHHIAFTKTSSFARFKELAGPFFAGPSDMKHFALL